MSTTKHKILIIDDDTAVCQSLKLLFKKRGFEADSVSQPQIAIDKIAEYQPSLIVLDMNFTIDTSGRQGLKLLRMIMEHNPDKAVILMTGWATVQLAVEGMKIGAKDFLAKPWDNHQLIASVHTILDLAKINRTQLLPKTEEMTHIIGKSHVFMEVMDMAQRVAKTDANILIMGESGTGKEVLAEAIHQMSKRSQEQFVKVNLGGIPSTLFESEMFGHKKGAFTDASVDRVGRFELANNGSIFLDEIGELPLENQVKLLRVLQEKKFEILGSSITKASDFRVISATNKDLPTLVNLGDFREDLYYRINLITLYLPSLKERKTDIPLLTKSFIQKTALLYEVDEPYLDQPTIQWLTNQEFPGNIRQLKNLVERTVLLNLGKKELTFKDFQKCQNSISSSSNKGGGLPGVGDMSLDEMEKQMIVKSLRYHNFSISKTAISLGITRSSLYRRMEKYGINQE